MTDIKAEKMNLTKQIQSDKVQCAGRRESAKVCTISFGQPNLKRSLSHLLHFAYISSYYAKQYVQKTGHRVAPNNTEKRRQTERHMRKNAKTSEPTEDTKFTKCIYNIVSIVCITGELSA